MSLARPYGVGLKNVGSYQVSGQPYITGSNISGSENQIVVNQQIRVEFPYVTKTLQLWNYSQIEQSRLRIHFAESGSIHNHPASHQFYSLSPGESLSISLKCKEVYLSAVGATTKWKLYASLTNIASSHMYELSGSGINYP
jgi:hypothetical protein